MIISFGKYKGREIDVFTEDLSYARWMLAQEWFTQKHPDLAKAIEILFNEESKEAGDKPLKARENMLLSIDLKSKKTGWVQQ